MDSRFEESEEFPFPCGFVEQEEEIASADLMIEEERG
jgi:hypothetical protein